MTREELKAHCLKQIENCEIWARLKGEEPYGKVYEEHELILELLEQGQVLDKIRAEIKQNAYPIVHGVNNHELGMTLYGILQVIDKYTESEEME